MNADGRPLAFAAIVNLSQKSELDQREAMDRLAAGLAGCGCR